MIFKIIEGLGMFEYVAGDEETVVHALLNRC